MSRRSIALAAFDGEETFVRAFAVISRRAGLVLGFASALLLCICLTACGGTSGSSGSPPTVSSISVSPTPVTLNAGQSQQLTATAKYSDGSTKDVTSAASWTSSNAAVAKVANGLITSVAAGSTTITASFSGLSGSDAVAVNPKSLTTISVSPTTVEFPIGGSQQYSATGTYTDGSTSDLTAMANWSSSAPPIAMVSTGGLVSGLASGTATISASASGATGTAAATVIMPIPTSWTPMGLDYGLKKQCVRTPWPSQPNFFYDDVDCPGTSYPTGGYWTTAVDTENPPSCNGTVNQFFQINGSGSPVTEAWTGDPSSGYSVELKTDYTNIANPCAPNTWTWVPLMDSWSGGGPLPAPNQLVVQFNATFNRKLPANSGATRAFAGIGAQWDIAGSNGQSKLATFSVEINFYVDQPQWGKQPNLPPDVIGVINGGAFDYYVALDGSKLFAPISAPLGTSTQLTVNWAAVLQHVVDEGLFPAPTNGWTNSNAVTSGTFAGTEVMNSLTGPGGPMADLIVSGYEEGSF